MGPDRSDLPHVVQHSLSDLRQVVLGASVSLLGQPWLGGWWDTDCSWCLLCVGCSKHWSGVRFWCRSRATRTGGGRLIPLQETWGQKEGACCSVRSEVNPAHSASAAMPPRV